MLTIYLMAYVCTTAARDDCQPQYVNHYTGPSASFRCELERDGMLEGRNGQPPLKHSELIRLECEIG